MRGGSHAVFVALIPLLVGFALIAYSSFFLRKGRFADTGWVRSCALAAAKAGL